MRFDGFICFPDDIQQLALVVIYPDDCPLASWTLITLALVQLLLFGTFFIKKIQTNIMHKIIMFIAMLGVPVIVFIVLYIDILPIPDKGCIEFSLRRIINVGKYHLVSRAFLMLALIHLLALCTFFIKKIQTNLLYRVVLLVVLLLFPVMIFGALYVGALPRA